jgi:hypothetical protein
MRIGRVIAVASGAALAGFGVMQLRKARASDPGRGEPMPADPTLDLTSLSSNAEEPKLSSVPE